MNVSPTKELWERTRERCDRVLAKPCKPYPADGYWEQVRQRNDYIEGLAFAYVMTGEKKYADRAIEEIKALLDVPHWVETHRIRRGKLTTVDRVTAKVAAVMGTCIYGYGCRPLEGLWRDYQWSLRENWGCHNTMFRRDIVLGVGNFSEAIKGPGEDFDLYLRLLDSGYRWVWVREAVVYHPMTLSEYVARMYRWSRGLPYIRSLMREAASKSLSTVYQNSLFSVVEGFRNGIVLSARVHPTLLLYFPLLKIVSQFAGLNELKRTLRSRDQGPQQMHVP